MKEANVTSAKYIKNLNDTIGIIAIIDGIEWQVPIAEGNRHYRAILAWVEEGNEIEAAD
tara:strand:- start:200 stop:376 length:177 start_codon:yes stop_codon:yes gene_type:complete